MRPTLVTRRSARVLQLCPSESLGHQSDGSFETFKEKVNTGKEQTDNHEQNESQKKKRKRKNKKEKEILLFAHTYITCILYIYYCIYIFIKNTIKKCTLRLQEIVARNEELHIMSKKCENTTKTSKTITSTTFSTYM